MLDRATTQIFLTYTAIGEKKLLQYTNHFQQYIQSDNVGLFIQWLHKGKAITQAEMKTLGGLIKIQNEAPASHKSHNYIGQYRIDGELGRGGMGVVYRAFDTKLKRNVALKMLHLQTTTDNKSIQRFMIEASTLAQLDHPNIVKIFEIGNEAQNYFVMEYITGCSLKEKIRNEQLNSRETAKIFHELALGLGAVHRKKILHRDIKPANIMITKQGIPKIMDFGLAKVENSDLSQSGDLVGTPAYLSPEQAQGQDLHVTSDIYSLGASLYEVLTGRPPFQGDNIFNIVYQINREDPVAPRKLNPDIPLEIEAICLKCLDKSTGKRYQTMRELAQDLKNFTENKAIIAKPSTKYGIFLKFLSRNRKGAMLASLVLFIMAFGIAQEIATEKREKDIANKEKDIAEQQKNIAEQRENIAEQKRERAEKQRERAEIASYFLGCQTAFSYIHYGHNIERAENILSRSKKSLRNVEWGFVKALCHKNDSVIIQHGSPTAASAISQDSSKILSLDESDVLKIWDSDSKESLLPGKYRGPLCFHPNNKDFVYTRGKNLFLYLWDNKQSIALPNPKNTKLNFLQFSRDGKLLAAADKNGIQLWQSQKYLYSHYRLIKGLAGPTNLNAVKALDFDTSGKYLVFVGEEGIIRILDIAKRTDFVISKTKEGSEIRCCNFSPDATSVVVGFADGTMQLWNITTTNIGHHFIDKSLLNRQKSHSDAVNSCKFSHSGEQILSTSDDATIKIWSSATGDLQGTYYNSAPVLNGYWLQQNQFATHGYENAVKLWNVDNKHYRIIQAHRAPIRDIDVFENLLITCSDDFSLKLWNIATGTYQQVFQGHLSKINCCRFNAQGTQIVSGGENDMQIIIWDLNGKILKRLQGHRRRISSCYFSRDGEKILSASEDGIVKLWDIATQKNISFSHPGKVKIENNTKVIPRIFKHAIFNQDESLIIAVGFNSMVVFDVKTREIKQNILIQRGFVESCVFDAEYKKIATASGPVIKIWDFQNLLQAKSHEDLEPLQLSGHKGGISSCSFDSNGKRLISCSKEDHTIKIWNLEKKSLSITQDHLIIDYPRKYQPTQIFLTKDNAKIIATDYQGTVYLWDLQKK